MWILYQIEKADVKGDLKTIYRGVRGLSDTKNRFSNTQSTTDTHGHRIKSPGELSNIWNRFLTENFTQSEFEQIITEYEVFPPSPHEDDVLTRHEFDTTVLKMKKQKTTDKDNIPEEVWQNSKVDNNLLFVIWIPDTNLGVSVELTVGIFVMI